MPLHGLAPFAQLFWPAIVLDIRRWGTWCTVHDTAPLACNLDNTYCCRNEQQVNIFSTEKILKKKAFNQKPKIKNTKNTTSIAYLLPVLDCSLVPYQSIQFTKVISNRQLIAEQA